MSNISIRRQRKNWKEARNERIEINRKIARLIGQVGTKKRELEQGLITQSFHDAKVKDLREFIEKLQAEKAEI